MTYGPSMTTTDFLSNPDVSEMTTWVAGRFDKASGWTHGYRDRRTGVLWSCAGLADAWEQYSWNGKPWSVNKAELDLYRSELRASFTAANVEAVTRICAAILQWGGVWANNGRYLARQRPVLLDELRQLSVVLTSDHTPLSSDLLRDREDPGSKCRLNAGFVKIYSVLLDHCAIYDGRVGAALGLLARQFCRETGRLTIPPCLAFAYGTPKESANSQKPKLRDPSEGAYRFPRLGQDSRLHTEHAMRANWFLRRALELNPGPFTKGEAGFHELSAGLFMVGYDLGGIRGSSDSSS